MNLKHLTDECLLTDTARLVRREREILTDILHHLREIERRRLFDGCSSLFDYATRRCGYSEDQACRRIAAMRLLKDLPQLEEKIESGQINLSHVGVAQSLFKNEKLAGNALTASDKMEVFEAIAGQSARESQRTVARFSSQPPAHRDLIKSLGDGSSSVSIKVRDETLAKIEKLKGLLAHENPEIPIGQLLDQLCDLALRQWDPAREPRRPVRKPTRSAVRRAVWKRDGGACVNCGSTYAVQEDHRLPKSMSGSYTAENMRLLCRTCNQRAAIEKLGLEKMERHLTPAAVRPITRDVAGSSRRSISRDGA